MKTLIVGLGLIGGAYAYRLSLKGYEVYGIDNDIETIEFAKENNYIIDGSTAASDYIDKVDVIILAIYPKAIINFLTKYNSYIKPTQIITDVCGVKSSFLDEATKLAKPAIYCSHHPMAGKEKIGIRYSKECIFEGANFLITPHLDTPKDVIDTISKLGYDLGFKNVSVMNYKRHDEMIGFTSQLTHAIAVSLVNSDHDAETKKFIGDSYRDLTRIAMINENLWSELFLENKEFLLKHIDSFENELGKLKEALLNDDTDNLKKIFKSSTRIRKEMEK